MSENNKKDNKEITYSAGIKDLKDIIQQFQKGSMKLSDAVDKYNLSQQLIKICSEKIDVLEKSINEKEKSIEAVKDKDFEGSLIELEKICYMIESGGNFELEDVKNMFDRAMGLIQLCEKQLEEFKHVIEYKND